ncbi:hypothetical protein D769_02668 [Cupriavidus sp. HMR-1]|uniref:DUF6279 family lipoprotein n=1 Tax=Cupriavidus sp. HMR-1 TaxID=1249621 RepID=UPI0002A2FA2D|nr:DUF6279 family lipoprotein [Cupriavidus sp. HMR-1]ELA00972.1 hypothetical protein D769_02668 [Cupriavidus sp. HMR-1]
MFVAIATLTFVAVLGGCNAMKLGYEQGDRLAYWWVDRYVDVSDAQEVPTRDAIARFFAWHRRSQLPEVTKVLARVKGEVAGPVDIAMIREAQQDSQRLGRQAYENTIPDLAELMLTLSPDQIKRMETKFAESNTKYRKQFLGSDADARTDARYDKIMDYAKLVYGSFSRDQEKAIRDAMGPYMLNADARYSERVRRQQEWVALAREISTTRPPKAQAEEMLRHYADDWQRPATGQQRSTDAGINLTVTIANLTTPEQKAHAVKRFQGWIEDVQALMREPGRSAQASQ